MNPAVVTLLAAAPLVFQDPVPVAAAAEQAPFEVNPFGTWFTVATWAVLIALNLYCFLRLFSARPPVPAVPVEPTVEPSQVEAERRPFQV
ncbi:MAG TPA: hypothetical protein VGC54_08010 [Planctomycetota bacterium]